MAKNKLSNMTAKICCARHCSECPIDGHCISPFSDEDAAVIEKAYKDLFGYEPLNDNLELDEDDLMNLLSE